MFLISREARLIHFSVSDVPVLSGAGKGVRGIKLDTGDVLLGAQKMSRPSDTLKVINDNDKVMSFGQMKYTVTSRGGKGVKVAHRSTIKSIVRPELICPTGDKSRARAGLIFCVACSREPSESSDVRFLSGSTARIPHCDRMDHTANG